MPQQNRWVTRLEETDYSVIRKGMTVIFQDNRNQKAYQLNDQIAQHIRQSIGLLQPDSVWIRIAINNALIPHPFDEWI